MRKLKLLLVLCLVAITASASKTVYLVPQAWDLDGVNERFALYMYDDNAGTDAWTSFVKGDNGVWSAEFDEQYPNMIICRMNGDNNENGWANKWTQTANLAAPFADGLTYTITARDDSNNANNTFYISAYLYNPTTGLFLSRGAGYGTACWADNFGIPVIFVSNDGGYRLQYIDQTDQYVSDRYWSWADGGTDRAQTYTVSAVEGGYKLINKAHGDANLTLYIAEGADGAFTHQIASNGKYGDNCNENWDVWQFKSSAEREAILAANKSTFETTIATTLGYSLTGTLAELVGDANTFASTDKTSSIANADLVKNYTPGWTYTKKNSGNDPTKNNNDGVEVYQGCGTFSQTVSGLTNGLYKVAVGGFYRDGWNARCSELSNNGWKLGNAYLEANGNQVRLADWASDRSADDAPNGTGAAKTLINNGKYHNEVFAYVTDGTLTISIAQPGGATAGRWFFLSNATLTYYSDKVADEDATAVLATANGIKDSKMYSGVKTALASAISAFNGNKTIANYNALNTAISNANASIANYAELLAAITNANDTYPTAFKGGKTLFDNAVAVAQAVYDAAEVDDCADAITALANGLHAAYESDYGNFATDYEYDYSTLLSNDLTKWTTSDYVVMTGTEHWNGEANQRYYEQSGAEWGSSAWNHAASETAVLPAGKYVMSITARAAADVTSTMSVKIGDNDAVVVPLPHKGSVGRGVTTAGEGSFADGTYANNNNGRGWEYRFIAFELAEESSVTISFNSSTNKQYNWVSIASPLLKGNVHPNQIKLNQVHTLTATLKGYEGSISAETYATFADNIAAAEAATLESANLDAIITALTADVETAKAEKVIFDRGAAMNALNTGDNSVVLTEEATAANWTPTPTLNTWSTEADNTGMVKPFLQNWKSKNDGALADNTETYVPIRGLKKGYYEVSALVRIYSESGAEPSATSAIFTVNGKSVSLLDGTNFVYNNMKGIYNTVRVVVYTEDALNISLAYEGANFNWIAWKNLKVTYLTENANPVYAVAGSAPFFSGSWDQTTQADILTEESEGVYTKTYANQILDAQTIEYKVVKKDLLEATHATAWYPNDNQTISIPVKGKYDITFTFTESGSVVSGVATKTAEAVYIGNKGWATTVTNSALNFSAQSDVEAYTATVEGNVVKLADVLDVQAETGLVLKGDSGTYYIPVIASSETDKGSLMYSSIYGFDIYSHYADNYYGLTFDDEKNVAKFALINKPIGDGKVTIPAGKAFLAVSSNARELTIVFDDETTGIQNLTPVFTEGDGAVYDLQGRKVAQPTKGGLYIVNGKKVVIK